VVVKPKNWRKKQTRDMLASRSEGNKIATRLLQVVRSKEDKRRKFCRVSNCAIGGKYVQTSGGVEVVEIVKISVVREDIV
jgi:hypothetical protein